MNFFAGLVIFVLKKIIKINSAAIMRVITELVTRPRFSKAISLVYIMFIFF